MHQIKIKRHKASMASQDETSSTMNINEEIRDKNPKLLLDIYPLFI
jgi:hypothetical protein